MQNRLFAAVIAVFAVALGGLILLLVADGLDGGEDSSAPVVAAQVAPVPAVDATGTFTEAEQAAINQMIAAYLAANADFIRDYLIAYPEVLQEVVTELERRRIDEEAARRADAIDRHRDLIFDSNRQIVLGNPNGDVTLVEFFDYNCTYCKRALDDMIRLIDEDPNLRVVLKEFPVLGVGSTEAAQVAAAVAMIAPELYGDFHLLLLSSSAQATRALALQAATAIGLDAERVAQLMQNPEAVAFIEEAYMLADALGLTGTPSYVLGNDVIVGAVGYDALRRMIDSVRSCGETVCI